LKIEGEKEIAESQHYLPNPDKPGRAKLPGGTGMKTKK